MAADANARILVRFKDVDESSQLREHLEQRCHHLGDEFPELVHTELALSPNALEIAAHATARGKDTDCAAHATAPDARQAADRALDKLERELRKSHDKRIFVQRREAQRNQPKRNV